MTSATDRITAIELVDEAKLSGARESKACEELEISQRTVQRWRTEEGAKGDKRTICERPTPQNKLTQEESKRILELINEPEFQSSPPSQIVPALADDIYLRG